MKEFRAKAIINANALDIWRALLTVSAYAQFDSLSEKIEGEIKNGGTLKIVSKRQPYKSMSMNVTLASEHHTMIWQGAKYFHLLHVTRTFKVIAKDDLTSEFHLQERFDGIIPSLCPKLIGDFSNEVEQFARGVKHFIESRP